MKDEFCAIQKFCNIPMYFSRYLFLNGLQFSFEFQKRKQWKLKFLFQSWCDRGNQRTAKNILKSIVIKYLLLKAGLHDICRSLTQFDFT